MPYYSDEVALLPRSLEADVSLDTPLAILITGVRKRAARSRGSREDIRGFRSTDRYRKSDRRNKSE